MENRLKRNIKVIYALAFFHMFMLIVPVLVPFFQSKGLSLAEVFYLQAVYAAAIVLLEAPSGYFADVMGRRLALIVGAAAHGLGYLWLNFADDFFGLIIFELILGFAMSMLSGADLALLYDSEKALAQEDQEHAPGVAHLGFTKSLAEGSGALLGGVLAMWSFDLMVLMQSVTAWICLALALLITEPPLDVESATDGVVDTSAPTKRNAVSFREIWQHVAKGDPILRLVFIALPMYNLVSINVTWLVQPYWDDMGLSLALFGVLWCAQSITVAIATQCGFALEKKKGAVFALVVIGILPMAGVFGMAWIGGWIGLAFGFVLFFCRGLYQVILVNALNRRIPGKFRATVNSLNSLVFRFGFIVTGPALGFVADHYGLGAALSLIGVGSALTFVLVMLPLIKAVKGLPSARQRPDVSTP
ncbi:MAG: MFS transporter [Pseudohongiella sp.]|nr:MFS transporter [Pseudohongiella sp.]MDO9520650.1 MFS transporter [Pseudohongiella sp.]MDP2127920.1 MFS transporter [Pseudohongiella sp.]